MQKNARLISSHPIRFVAVRRIVVQMFAALLAAQDAPAFRPRGGYAVRRIDRLVLAAARLARKNPAIMSM